LVKRCSPDDEDGDGEVVAAAGRRRRATKECGGPRRVAVPSPPYSLEMVLVWRCLSSSLAAFKGRQIRGYGSGLQKIGFPVNI
jgi:hypothetical protein